MNKIKTSNLLRSIAFFLTSVILICTFGFTVDGWIVDENGDQSANIPTRPFDDYEPELPTEGETEEPDEPEIYIPEYVNRLTGLECSEDIAGNEHIAIVTDSSGYCYGIYGADILCEIPTEVGTRFLCIRNDISNLWKIGAILPTRGYITSLSSFFGATLLSAGEDDKIEYTSSQSIMEHIDITDFSSAYYTEFTDRIYTNHKLLSDVISLEDKNQITDTSSPFNFVEFGEEEVSFEFNASNITINFDLRGVTQLKFDENTGEYIIYKDGEILIDNLSAESPEFTNCFVLFADSVTYDNSDGTNLVMNTIGYGKGYYITKGSFCTIKWESNVNGELEFFTTDGENLVVNRGQSYIAYLKSSRECDVVFE